MMIYGILIACGVSTFTLLWVLAILKAGARYDEAFERCQIDFGALEGDLSAFVAEQNAMAAE